MGLENFLIYLKREISFSFSDISTVIRSYSSSSEDVRNLLEGFIEGSVAIPKFLSESERLFVLEFFEKIGKSDKVNELELINFFQDEICKLREMENIKCIKMSKIYVKLGFFIGMIVFVVIV